MGRVQSACDVRVWLAFPMRTTSIVGSFVRKGDDSLCAGIVSQKAQEVKKQEGVTRAQEDDEGLVACATDWADTRRCKNILP